MGNIGLDMGFCKHCLVLLRLLCNCFLAGPTQLRMHAMHRRTRVPVSLGPIASSDLKPLLRTFLQAPGQQK